MNRNTIILNYAHHLRATLSDGTGLTTGLPPDPAIPGIHTDAYDVPGAGSGLFPIKPKAYSFKFYPSHGKCPRGGWDGVVGWWGGLEHNVAIGGQRARTIGKSGRGN